MSKIEYDGSTGAFFNMYRQTLQEKITSVCNKIGFDDSKITWIIFDPKVTSSHKPLSTLLVGTHGQDYGYCDPVQKKIWISTLALQRSKKTLVPNMGDILGRKSVGDDFLANVLPDEITHIQTGYNHGSLAYDKKFQENIRKYYLSPFDQVFLK